MYICSRGRRPLSMTRVQAAAAPRFFAAVQLARSWLIPAWTPVAMTASSRNAPDSNPPIKTKDARNIFASRRARSLAIYADRRPERRRANSYSPPRWGTVPRGTAARRQVKMYGRRGTPPGHPAATVQRFVTFVGHCRCRTQRVTGCVGHQSRIVCPRLPLGQTGSLRKVQS